MDRQCSQAWSSACLGAGVEQAWSRPGGAASPRYEFVVLRDDQQWKGRRPYDNGARYALFCSRKRERRRQAGLQSVSYGAGEDHRTSVMRRRRLLPTLSVK
ncbi:hypothetical protein TYRP_023664 [Tyrophagus putrescentiae]|nr:hypothetical protein TYRP_023664 [Tyrophagus putrescentiae]